MKFIISSIFKTLSLSLCVIANVHLAYSQTASILPPAKTTFVDQNGKPLSSGKVDFYIPNTTTRKTTWQDAAETIPNTNPVILDSAGRALILGSGDYRQVVKDRNGNTIWDQVTSSTGSGGGTGPVATGDGDLVGTIKPWAGMTAPNQYMFTYGQEVSRTTYAALFTAITSSQPIFCNSGSPTLNGLSDTTNFWIGMSVEVSCLGAGFSTIVSKTASTVTLAANANITTNTTATFFTWGRGNGTTTFTMPDLRGQTLVGNNNMGGSASSNLTATFFGSTDPNSSGAFGGAQSITIVTNNLPPYTPSGSIVSTLSGGSATIPVANLTSVGGATDPNRISLKNNANADAGSFSAGTSISGTITSTFTGAAQGGTSTPISRIQPSKTINYIIKVTPDQNSATASGVTSLGLMTGDIACGVGLLCTGNNISISSIPAATNVNIGGVIASSCSSSNWFNSLGNGTGVFGCSQPNFTDLLGSISISQIPNSLITYVKIQNGTGLSLLGVSGNISAANADIVATSDNQIMRRSGSSIGFGAINLASASAISGLLPLSNGGCNANLTASNGGIFWSNSTQCQILAGIATSNLPLLSGTNSSPSWATISYPTSATSGGVLYFNSTTSISSSSIMTANAFMVGGGAGTAPSAIAITGLVVGNGGSAPTAYAGQTCTNQFIRALSASGAATCNTISLTSDVTGILPITNGGTSQSTALAARSSSGLNVDQFTGHGDSNYTILSTDRTIGTNASFTSARTWTLPAANSVNAGQEIIVSDFQGTVTASNTLAISRAGADTINGGTSVTISSANGAYLFRSDGISKWTAQALGAAAAGGVSSVTCGTGLTGGTITTSGTCAVDYATKSDQQTGTATAKSVNPAHQQDHDSAEKAWFTMSSTCSTGTCSLGASYNITSVVFNSTGNYTVTFTTPFSSANYVCTGNMTAGSVVRLSTKTTSTIIITSFDTSFGSFNGQIDMSCRGRQ